jgi:zinc transporter 7
MMIIFCCKSE